MTKVLIVNADDFGRSRGINRGIVCAHDDGVVTSASAMVCWSAAEEAAALARDRPWLGVGLHVDLGEWVWDGGKWRAAYERSLADRAAVSAEVTRQLARFRELFGADPTHLDSHQHVHREEPARSIIVELGRSLEVPVRDNTPGLTYRGDFYGQTGHGDPLPETITVDALLRLLASLSNGVTEIGCHPAAEAEVSSRYAAERVEELRVLCDSRIRAAVAAEEIELRSFRATLASVRE